MPSWGRADDFAVRVALANVLWRLSSQSQRGSRRLSVLAPLVKTLIQIRFSEQDRRRVDAKLICHPCMRQVPGVWASCVRQICHVPRRSIADAENVHGATALIKRPQVDF